MKKLLTIEYLKLRKLKSLWVILILYAIITPLALYSISYFITNFMGPMLPDNWSALQFPDVWSVGVYASSYFNVLMGVLAVIVIGNEFVYKTFRQHVIDGLSLQQAIFAKFLVVLCFSIIITVYTFLTGLIYGTINTTDGTLFTSGIENIGLYFIQTLCYLSLAFCLTVLLRKKAISIALFVVAFIVETVIGVLLQLADLTVVYAFFPLNAFSKLTPFPILKQVIKAGQARSGSIPYILSTPVNVAVCFGYMIIFFLVSYWVLKKRDL